MKNLKKKEAKRYISPEQVKKYENAPFFIKKREQAKKTIEKYGLAEQIEKIYSDSKPKP